MSQPATHTATRYGTGEPDQAAGSGRYVTPAFCTSGTHVLPATLRHAAPDRLLPGPLTRTVGASDVTWAAARFGEARGPVPGLRYVPAHAWQPLTRDLRDLHGTPLFSTEHPAVVAVALTELAGPPQSTFRPDRHGEQLLDPDLFFCTLPLSTRSRNLLAALYESVRYEAGALARLSVPDLLAVRGAGMVSVLEIMSVIGAGVDWWLASSPAARALMVGAGGILGHGDDLADAPQDGARMDLPAVPPFKFDFELDDPRFGAPEDEPPVEPWSVPEDLAAHADAITGDDPRFGAYLQHGQSLTDAAAAQSLFPDVAEELFARIRQILAASVEDAVQDLVFAACQGDPRSNDRLRRRNITLDNGWREALIARYGLAGDPPATLEEAAHLVPSNSPVGHVTRERVRQKTSSLDKRLPKTAWMPPLHRALQVLVEESPVAVEEVGQVLAPHGLSGERMHADALLALVELTGTDVAAATGTRLVVQNGWLVDERETGVTGAVSVAARHTSKFGMTTMEEVRQTLVEEGTPADIEDVERVLRADARIRWSSDGWLWVHKRDVESVHANSMRNHVRAMLSVNAPQDVPTLQEGVRRAYKFRQRDIVPPVQAMTEFLSDHPEFVVKDGLVHPVEPLDYHDVLGDVTVQMVDVLKASPYGVMDRASLHEECAAAGIRSGTYGIWTTYAEWMASYGRNVWGLRGQQVSPAVIDEIQRAAKQRHRSEARERRWAWTPDGRIALVADVNTNLRTTGVVVFPPSLRQTLGERRFTIVAPAGVNGEIAISAEHDWTWGWGPALAALNAKVGQVLRATLDLTAGTAHIEVGGRELFDGT